MSYKDKEFLTGKEFREVLSISAATLNRWVKSGKIQAIRINDANPYSELRIPSSEIDRLLAIGANPTEDKGE